MPKILPIITYPDAILRTKCEPVGEVDAKIRRLISDMEATMKEKQGIGLAAPQVGKTIRVILISTKDGVLAMVNPKITKKSFRREKGEEGCLSIPEFYGAVKRWQKINVVYTDAHGQKIKLSAQGLLARVIQHEIDHINGILFIDYLKKKDLPEYLVNSK